MKSRAWFSQVSLQFALVLIALVALNLAVLQKHGYYSRTAALEVVLALVAALAACRYSTNVSFTPRLAPDTTGEESSERLRKLPLLLMGTAALFLSGKAFFVTRSMTDAPPAGLLTLTLAAGTGWLLILLFATFDLFRPESVTRDFRVRLFLLFAAATVLRIATVVIWPEPPIDVFVWMREAPKVLLEGHNPYVPENMSQGALAVYPPLPILMTVPFSAVGLDVRYANVVCDLLAAWLLYVMARRRGRPLLGALIAGTYLNLPAAPFMIKHAWYEPMLAALLAGGIALAERGNRLGNLLLGLGLTGKQFGPPMLLPLWRTFRDGRRPLLVGVGLAAGLLIVPFFLWSPADFLNATVYLHLAIPPDLDSLTLRSIAYHFLGVSLSGVVAGGLTLLLTCWVAWRTPVQREGTGLWMGTALLIFCLFYIKGYFNYFYLCSYLFLLGLTGLAPPGSAGTSRERIARSQSTKAAA
jgi:hypothetical protein